MQASLASCPLAHVQAPRCARCSTPSRATASRSAPNAPLRHCVAAARSCGAPGSLQMLRPAQPTGLPNLGRGVAQMRRCRGGAAVVRAENVNFKDRAVAAGPYLVPLFDSLRYGKFALVQTPFLYTLLAPLDPLIQLYTAVPFASLAVFFAIYLGIINNRSYWSRYVRYNAMQAILLDIILILPGVFENVFRPPMSGFGLTLYINVYNSIFFFVLASWLYGSGACLLGKTPRLPLVADAADQQVPF